jgi:hypothetical protein
MLFDPSLLKFNLGWGMYAANALRNGAKLTAPRGSVRRLND